MSCHRTPEIVADHFDRELSPQAREQVQAHVQACEFCRAEIALLAPAQELLRSWQPEAAPEWPAPDWTRDHGPASHQPRSTLPKRRPTMSWANAGRWLPLAASLVLSVAVLTQTRLDVSDQGWQVSFGSSAAEAQLQQLDVYLAEQASIQQQQNQQMLAAALQEFGDSTTDSLEQMATWFEQQRELDIQRMEAGFQQLLDRDYQTVSSVQQLASYVQYRGDQP
ncbi:hypothetical protein [Pseudohongiella acticola]|jgi:predicted anti-sigma-YlaC factor YlaD|uniref:anti-sigma factor family protein n=1 Tax=Pseudohongiella acticola TaxID=1524254 RepID=UPI0030EC7E5C